MKNFCRCYHEIHNNLPRSKFCRKPCSSQRRQIQIEKTKDIFNLIVPLALEEKFDQVKKILDDVDINNTEGQILVSYLSSTNPWKRSLDPNRENFVKKAEKILIKEVGEEKTENILKGLR